MAIESNRMLGFVGALLTVLGSGAQFVTLPLFFYPSAGFLGFGGVFGVLGFVGLILFMVAMYGFSKDYDDSLIFNNVLYGFITSIIGAVVAAGLAIAIVFMHLSGIVSPSNPSVFLPEFFQNFVSYLIPVFMVGTVIGLLQAFFNMRAFARLADKSEVRLFRKVGLLLVVSALVSMVMAFVAGLLVLVLSVSANVVFVLPLAGAMVALAAWILATKAYLTVKPAGTSTTPFFSTQTFGPMPATGQ